MLICSSFSFCNACIQDPARRFAELVHSFPTHASRLSSIKSKTTEHITAAVQAWHTSGLSSVLPSNCLLINGRHVNLAGNTFNVYDLLHTVRAELDQIIRLNAFTSGKLSLSATGLKSLQATAISLASSVETGSAHHARVDVSRGAKSVVVFINNLEKDDRYKPWPKHVSMLLQPSWSLQQIRRNLFTAVVIADPLTLEGAQLLYSFHMMLERNYPVRIGIVPTCSAQQNSDPSESARKTDSPATCADIVSLFMIARDKYSTDAAWTFLTQITQVVLESSQRKSEVENMLASAKAAQAAGQPFQGQFGGTTEDEITTLQQLLEEIRDQSLKDVISTYAMAVSAVKNDDREVLTAELNDIFPTVPHTREGYRQEGRSIVSSVAAKEYIARKMATAKTYIFERGLPINSFSINGIVEKSMEGLSQLLSREQQQLTLWVQSGMLTDKTKSLFATILTLTKAYPRYHPLLEQTGSQVEYLDTQANDRKVIQLIQGLSKSSGYLTSHADGVKYYNSVVLSIPPSMAGFQALGAALKWFGETQKVASKMAEGIANTSSRFLSANSLSYFFAVSDSKLTCYDGSVSHMDENGVCTASDIYKTPYLQLASFLHALQEHVREHPHWHADLLQLAHSASGHDFNISEMVSKVLPLLPSWQHLSKSQQEEVSQSMTIGSGAMLANLRKFNYNTRQAMSAKFYNAKSSPADITVAYNGRRLVVPIPNYGTVSHDALTAETPIMSEHDFTLLAAVERERMGKTIESILETISITEPSMSEMDTTQELSSLFLHMHSFCGLLSSEAQRFNVQQSLAEIGVTTNAPAQSDEHVGESLTQLPLSFQVIPVRNDSYLGDSQRVRIVYIVDPLSVAGQRAAALLTLVRDQLQLEQEIIFIPKLDIANNEFPLQNFYRYVLGGSVSTKDISAGRAVFKDLPRQHTLTVRMDAPERWNIQAIVAQQDIDNLRCLNKNDCGDRAVDGNTSLVTTIGYTLKSILVAGQCFETPVTNSKNMYGHSMLPVNGLQLTLRSIGGGGGEVGSVHSDTLVMQNLGYFQLAASVPGIYGLTLASGRGDDLYTIDGSSDIQPHAAMSSNGLIHGGKLISVRSFSDVDSNNRITVTKRPGMESQLLLEGGEDDDEALVMSRTGGRSPRKSPSQGKKKSKKSSKSKDSEKGIAKSMLSSLKSMFSSGGSPSEEGAGNNAVAASDGRIHVFSLATGHMYERLLRIMMLSVTKRTSMPVKFWLFENFLSPKFKDIAAAMAKEYGFEVGYVTYKWPAWLTQQTQKQRIIWGYKILFLDVLFPLGVNKVIYVDSDQVIRADLKELWDLDLKGKPYAYTPFCTSREETLGFQFWRQGYWNDHLQGKPYHISALYVVDLANFR